MIILLSLVSILIFLLITLSFYFDDIVPFFKFNNAKNSKTSVKYKKLQSSISLSDNSDIDSADDYGSSVDRIQFTKSTISSSKIMHLEVNNVEKSDENNDVSSLSRPNAVNNVVNGHAYVNS